MNTLISFKDYNTYLVEALYFLIVFINDMLFMKRKCQVCTFTDNK